MRYKIKRFFVKSVSRLDHRLIVTPVAAAIIIVCRQQYTQPKVEHNL